MARGNEKSAIFRDDSDRHAYIERLVSCRKRFGFRLYAFCLMSNHVHLALERGEAPLSRVMLALHSAYAGDFNRRHGRVGHLFQGRYKAFLVEKEVYLITLIRYIHLNPVHARMVRRPAEYRWSTDRYYRAPEAPPWLDRTVVMETLGASPDLAASAYRQLMATDAATYQDASVSASVIKGTDLFVKHVMRSAKRSADADRVVRRCSVEQIASLTAASAGLTVDQLRAPGQHPLVARERGLAAYVGWKHARIPLARTARLFNREESTLVRAVRRIEAALVHDRSLSRRLAFVVSSLEQLEASAEASGKDQEFTVDPETQSSGVHG